MFFSVRSTGYGWLVIGLGPILAVGWAISEPCFLTITAGCFTLAAVVLASVYCHLPGLSLGDAIGRLCAPFCSGCANITILYIWLVVLYHFLAALIFSISGLMRGREHSRERWHGHLVRHLLGTEAVDTAYRSSAPGQTVGVAKGYALVKCQGVIDGRSCSKTLRVPTDRGRLEIVCPVCGWRGHWQPEENRWRVRGWVGWAVGSLVVVIVVAVSFTRAENPTLPDIVRGALPAVAGDGRIGAGPRGQGGSASSGKVDSSGAGLLRWRVGEIDPRFKITKTAAEEAVRRAIAVWERAADRHLFLRDDSGGFPIVFVYDSRQETLNAEAAARVEVRADLRRVDACKVQLDRADRVLNDVESRLRDEEASYDQQVRDYNGRVQSWNAAGGAPDDVAGTMDAEKSALAAEASGVDRDRGQVSQLLDARNALAGEQNGWAEAYDQALSAYNSRFGADVEEMGTCEHEGGRPVQVTVYAFENREDLAVTLAHELGHALGLGHVKGDGSIMSAVQSLGHPLSLRLSEEDRMELRAVLAAR